MKHPHSMEQTLQNGMSVELSQHGNLALSDGVKCIRSDIGALADLMRAEIHAAFDKLCQQQSAATESHGSVLRTLTEAIFTSSAATGSAAEVESLLLQFEGRLTESLRDSLQNSSTTSRSGGAAAGSGKEAVDSSGSTKPQATAGSGGRSWDEIRSAFLSDPENLQAGVGESAHGSATSMLSSVQKPPTSPVSGYGGGAFKPLPAEPEPPLEIPPPIDLDQLSDPEVRLALIDREKLISSLIARMRRQNYSVTDQITTDQLRQLAMDMPEELSRRIQHTLGRLDEQIRLGELEMSIERARIAREMTQLNLTRQHVQQAAHQLGWTINPDGTLNRSGSFPARGSSSRRWLGKLGLSE